MNDPHVVAVMYRLIHSNSVNYDNAKPLEHDEAVFRVRVGDGHARFEMKDHFATDKDAREVIDPFIRAWELDATLKQGPGEFELAFKNCEIVDRNPTPGVVEVRGLAVVTVSASAKAVVGRSRFPDPPSGIAVNDDIEIMLKRYAKYREGKETLANMAYFCLTVLEADARGRSNVRRKYFVEEQILKKLGELTSTKGGEDARKAIGRPVEFTEAERTWVDAAIKSLIRRAAEVAHDPSSAKPLRRMSDLPNL